MVYETRGLDARIYVGDGSARYDARCDGVRAVAYMNSCRGEERDLDVATDLDRLIERRAQGRTGRDAANERERLRKEGVERHNAQVRKEHRALWYAHFCRQAEAHRKLSEDYEARAEALCQEGVIDAA